MSNEINYDLAMDKSRAPEETVAAILIAVIFGAKNLVRQEREDVVEQVKIHAMRD